MVAIHYSFAGDNAILPFNDIRPLGCAVKRTSGHLISDLLNSFHLAVKLHTVRKRVRPKC
jgi:hypothetical protein